MYNRGFWIVTLLAAIAGAMLGNLLVALVRHVW